MPRRLVSTPFLDWLRALTDEQREAFAASCDTTKVYLYQMATQRFPNPRLRFALMLIRESERLAKRQAGIKPLKLDDLLIGTGSQNETHPSLRVAVRKMRDSGPGA